MGFMFDRFNDKTQCIGIGTFLSYFSTIGLFIEKGLLYTLNIISRNINLYYQNREVSGFKAKWKLSV